MRYILVSVFMLASTTFVCAQGPCTEAIVKQGNLPMADDAFSYMPPFGKPVSGKAPTQDTAEMKFAGRTNIKHSWESDRRRTFIYEPAGEAHTLVITEDSPEPMVTLFVVGGGLIYLDKAENGGFAAYEDGFSLLELCSKHYQQAGLDVRQLDLLVR